MSTAQIDGVASQAMDMRTLPRPVKTYHTKSYPRIDPHTSGFDGKGKTVLVTGGATGIGFATVKAFCKTGCQRVVILSRSKEPQDRARAELQKDYPLVQVITHQVSVADYQKVDIIVKELGSIDTVVLSGVATSHQNKPTIAASLADMQECFSTNVVGAFNLVQAFLSLPAPKQGHGRTVVNVASLAATCTIPQNICYGPSKAAVSQLMQHYALAQNMDTLGAGDVRFFSIHPGVIRTPATDFYQIPANAVTEWEDVNLPADFITWLSSDEAVFLSGRFVNANWDVDELLELKEKLQRDPKFLTINLVD